MADLGIPVVSNNLCQNERIETHGVRTGSVLLDPPTEGHLTLTVNGVSPVDSNELRERHLTGCQWGLSTGKWQTIMVNERPVGFISKMDHCPESV